MTGGWVLTAGDACVGVYALGILRGLGMARMLETSLSLGVAAVPGSLPSLAATVLALGVRSLRSHNVLFRKLGAVETLGSLDILCLDKTGTITRHQMEAVRVSAGGASWVPRVGKGPTEGEGTYQAFLRAIALCNEANLQEGGDAGEDSSGGPTELALLRLAACGGLDVAWGEIPARGSSLSWDADGSAGALHHGVSDEDLPRAFTWLGLVDLEDLPRPNLDEAFAKLHAAKVRTVLITGDQVHTAAAVAKTVGLDGGDPRPVDVSALFESGEGDARSAIAGASAFARTTPSHKLRLVEALREGGKVVAMTGCAFGFARETPRHAGRLIDFPTARVTHRVPGRVRLRIAERKQDRAYFESLRLGLEGVAGVRTVEVNPMTSSVLIETRGAADDVLATAPVHARFAVAEEAREGEAATRTLVEKASDAYDDLDASLRRSTGGAVQIAKGKVLPASVALFNSALLMISRK